LSAGPVASAAAATTTDQSGGSSKSADRGAECVGQSGLGVGGDRGHGDAAAGASPGHRHTAASADVRCHGDHAGGRGRAAATSRIHQLGSATASADHAHGTGEFFCLNQGRKKKKNLFPVGKYNINTQNAYKHQIFITAYRRLPESFYKLSMLATYNT